MFKAFRRGLRSLLSRSTRTRRRKGISSRPAEALEDRCLLTANLNLLGSGLLIYGGSGVDNDLEISFDGTDYTFADPAEPINATGGLSGLDTNPDPNIVTFDPTAIVGLFTRVVVNLNVGDDSTTIDSFRPGNEGLDIRDDAGEGTDSVFINGDIGTSAMPVDSLVIIRGENLNLGADIHTDNQQLTFSNDVDLTGDVELSTGTGTVELQGDVDGAFNLEVSGAGSVQVAGDIGATTPLTSVDLTSSDLTNLGGSVEATGNINITATNEVQLADDVLAGAGGVGSVTIDSPLTTLVGGGLFTVSSSLAGADSISVTGEINSGSGADITFAAGLGNLALGGDTSGLGSFVVVSSDTTDLDGVIGATDIEVNATTSLNAFGFQASAGDVDINTPSTTFDGAGASLVNATGTIDFSGTITGNFDDLLFRNATSVSIAGAVTDVDLFDARRGGGTLFTSVSVGAITAGDIIIEADTSTIVLFGDLISAGDITLIGRVEVMADIALISGGSVGDDINIFGSVHDPAVGARTLIIDAGAGAAQNLPLPPDVGIGTGGEEFLNVQVTGGIVTLFDVCVTNDLILEGGLLDLNGSLKGGGDLIFRPRVPGGTLNVVNGPTPVNIPDMTISAFDLAFIVPGWTNVIFGGPTAGAVILHPHATTGPFMTVANTRFEAPLIVINDDIDQGADELLFVADQIDFNRSLRGTGDVNIEDFGAPGPVLINGAMTYPAGLGAGAMNINFNMPLSDLTVTGNLGHRVIDLFVDAASASFPAMTAINVTGNVITTGPLSVNGGIFSLTGDIFVGDDLTMLGNTTIKVSAGSDFVVVGDIIGNGNNLTIRGAGGAINLVDVLGDIVGLGRLRIDSSGANTATTVALENVTATDILIRGVDIEIEGTLEATAGNLHLLGAVSLFGDTTLLNSSGVATRFVRVDGTINGAVDLNVDAGPGTAFFGGEVGGMTPLVNMDVTTTGLNYLVVPVTVVNDFTWTVGTFGNGLNDRLFVVGAGSVTAGNEITLVADQVVGEVIGGDLIAPTVNVDERGVGN